jgi:hypothetical protein
MDARTSTRTATGRLDARPCPGTRPEKIFAARASARMAGA